MLGSTRLHPSQHWKTGSKKIAKTPSLKSLVQRNDTRTAILS